MSFNVDWKGSNIIVSFSGVVSFAELHNADSLIYGDIRFDQMRYQVFDFSEIEDFVLNPHEMKIIGTLDKASTNWNNNVKVAIVTTSDKIVNLTKEYENTLEGSNWKTKIFKTVEEAFNWCNEL